MTTETGYILCATPRSGSTFLCRLLASTGVAGYPESWFRAQNMDDWARDWGIVGPEGLWLWPDYLAAAIRAGRAGQAVFGLRLMRDHFDNLTARLGTSRPRDFERCFGPLRYIHLRRRDLVAQAVSRHRAEVSGTWHLDFEEAAHRQVPQYDFDRISQYITGVETDNAAWQTWFSDHGIAPLALEYEDLARDPAGVAGQVLDHLGLTATQPPKADNRRMADATSLEWAARYRADLQRQGRGKAV